jgi:hypothetical protein
MAQRPHVSSNNLSDNIIIAQISDEELNRSYNISYPLLSPTYYDKVQALKDNSYKTPGILRGIWLTPSGEEIQLLDTKHINFLILNNRLFKITDDLIFSTYEDYNEKLGWEGRASQELLVHALRKGFIKVRYFGGRHSHWEIELWNLTFPALRQNIINWALSQLRQSEFSAPHCPVTLYEHQNKIKNELCLKDLPKVLRNY